MDLKLQSGDIYTDSRGRPIAISGSDEIIQRAMIRLRVKKGSFAPNPSLGSELHLLKREHLSGMEQRALAMAQEALYPIREIAVKGISGSYDPQLDRCELCLELAVLGEQISLGFYI